MLHVIAVLKRLWDTSGFIRAHRTLLQGVWLAPPHRFACERPYAGLRARGFGNSKFEACQRLNLSLLGKFNNLARGQSVTRQRVSVTLQVSPARGRDVSPRGLGKGRYPCETQSNVSSFW